MHALTGMGRRQALLRRLTMSRPLLPHGSCSMAAPMGPLCRGDLIVVVLPQVFGTKGAYRCLLEEQRGMSVADFKKLAYREDHQAPRQGELSSLLALVSKEAAVRGQCQTLRNGRAKRKRKPEQQMRGGACRSSEGPPGSWAPADSSRDLPLAPEVQLGQAAFSECHPAHLVRRCYCAGHREDALLERAFWSSITLSPPYYGADTPFSFFDQHLRFGWNLRGLDCLLSQHEMPAIPGVTTPMTYFGMWKVSMQACMANQMLHGAAA